MMPPYLPGLERLETGAVEFERVMERFMLRRPLAVRQAAVKKPVLFYAFDILQYCGRDLRALPLT